METFNVIILPRFASQTGYYAQSLLLQTLYARNQLQVLQF
jgi:hypothetical protein